MPWTVRVVKPKGKIYEVVYSSENTSGHIHQLRVEVSKEEYDREDRWDHFKKSGPFVCQECGKQFYGSLSSMGSRVAWDTEDGKLRVGDMYEAVFDDKTLDMMMNGQHFSDQYKRDWLGKRKPLYIVTPAGTWGIDEGARYDGRFDPNGWTVTGEAPNVTAHPSINFPGRYHGWLQNGVLTDDIEGRTF